VVLFSHELLIVSNKASIKQELTPVFESFRRQLDKVFAGGDTAVYDALDSARRMLVNYRSDLPKLRKRIIIVTDGSDTSSEASASEVCHALQKNCIIVDSVQVGEVPDRTLHSISIATGKDLS
jgi:Mg-chelatase subunit ChlD